MTTRYELKTPVRGKDGTVKFWRQIGRVVSTEKGFALYLDVVPVGWDGYAALMTPEVKGSAEESRKPAGAITDMRDDVPF